MDDEDSNHLEITKKLVDEMTVVENKNLLSTLRNDEPTSGTYTD